jgi:Icc protein
VGFLLQEHNPHRPREVAYGRFQDAGARRIRNHDYNVPRIPREFSHDLFRDKLAVKPYYSLDYKGFKFVHLNNFTGDRWNPKSAIYDGNTGSLGEEQLQWAEAELAQRKPTFVFIHYPLIRVLGR